MRSFLSVGSFKPAAFTWLRAVKLTPTHRGLRVATGCLLLALLAQPALRGLQAPPRPPAPTVAPPAAPPEWPAGIVQVKNSNLSPGTGFIVAFRSRRALIVTAAHVVEGDNKPKITFQGNRDTEFTATVLNQQVGEMRGFALLEVRDPPTGLRILEPQPGLQKPAPGTSVTVVGYPASVGVFSVVPSTVTATQAADLLISPATEEGFSGGPILIDGRVAGMTYGKQGAYGKAVPAAMVDTYLRLADPPVAWSAAQPAPGVPSAARACVCVRETCGNGAIPGVSGDLFLAVPDQAIRDRFQVTSNTGWTCFDPAAIRSSGGSLACYCADFCGNGGVGADPRYVDIVQTPEEVIRLYGGGKQGNHTGWLCGRYRGQFRAPIQ